ncbi:maleylpyruvate isomerase family mycothiol-dependent enzyme [soil metagenome]
MDYRRHIRVESDAFLAAALDGSMDAPVTSCPGWTVSDLVGHLGVVQRFHGANLARGITDPPTDQRPAPPETGLADWFREGVDRLLARLDAAGTDTPAWNFLGAQPLTTAFWWRRMALEAQIHRWDAELARGRAGAFNPDLAADGVDEVVTVFLPDQRRAEDPEGTVHLLAADGQRFRMISGDGSAANATISGTLDELLLVVWGRIPVVDLDVEGDMDLAATCRWR